MVVLSRSKHKSLFWLYDLTSKGVECRDMCTLVNGVVLGLLISLTVILASVFALFFVVFVPLMVLYVYITVGTFLVCLETVISTIVLLSILAVVIVELWSGSGTKEYVKSKLGKYCIRVLEVA